MKSFKEYMESSDIPFFDIGDTHPRTKTIEESNNYSFLRRIDDIPTLSTNTNTPHIKTWLEQQNIDDDYDDYDGYHEIHKHPNIAPKKLSEKQSNTIRDFTGKDSKFINRHLRGMAFDTGSKFYSATHNFVNTILSAFTPKNTVRQSIDTYSGIDPSVGYHLMSSKPGSQFHIPTFTSTSTNRYTAYDFSKKKRSNSRHMIHFTIESPEKGKASSAMSIVHHSEDPTENEVLLAAGSKITYNGTEIYHEGTNNPMNIYVHRVTVHPLEHSKPLNEYPGYSKLVK